MPAEDSFLLWECVKERLPSLPKGARVLDMGTGSGFIALSMARARPDLSVVATDISEEALAYASAQAEKEGLPITFLRSNLFSNLFGIFHLIAFNPPYLEMKEGEPYDETIHDNNTIEPFIWQAGNFLAEEGSFFLLLSDAHPRFSTFVELLHNLYNCRLCGKKNVFFETLYVYECKLPW